MNALFDAALEVENFMRSRGWRFCIIGGLAVIRWGQPRATRDIDISLLTRLGTEAEYVDEILRHFRGRVADARNFALQNRVLLAKASNGVALDIALAAFPFEEQVIARATPFEFAAGVVLTTASAEDLVVLKCFAGRNQDWADVEGIVARQRDALEWDYISTSLETLCEVKGDQAALARLEIIRRAQG